MIYKFREDGEYRATETFDMGDKTVILQLNEVGMDNLEMTTLKLRGYEGKELKLEKVFEAQGSSRKDAIENAQMVTYEVLKEDSILTFDSNITFKERAEFRAQQLDMVLYIPYNTKFIINDDLRHILENTIYRNGYSISDLGDNVWVFTRQGLNCTTCRHNRKYSSDSRENEKYDQIYTFDEFQDVEIIGNFIVNFVKSDDYKLKLIGNDQQLDKLYFKQFGDKLEIRRSGSYKNHDRNDVKLTISLPQLNDLYISGDSKVYIDEYKQEEMRLSLNGRAYVEANIFVDELDLKIQRHSEMNLSGSGEEMMVEITGNSELNAYEYEVRNAEIEAYRSSNAKVNVTNEIVLDKNFPSNVKYKGDPKVRNEREDW